MDTLSTSFLSRKHIHSHPTLSKQCPPPPRTFITAVRIQEKTKSILPSFTERNPFSLTHSSSPTPNRKPTVGISLLTTILNFFDDIINIHIDPPLRSSFDPRHVLSNNFAPVDELPPTECEVVHGTLPSCLDGAYIRNGPNPQYLPRGPYHLFDGDGMLHSIRIYKGRATLCSRYVTTYKYMIEKYVGSPVVPNVFSGFNSLTGTVARAAVTAVRVLAGQFDPANGIGLANTSLAFLGDKLYALGESDLPYEIKVGSDGEITTIGRQNFEGKLLRNMTAHPKFDPQTGEAFAFRCGPMPPFLTYFRFDKTGSKQSDVPIYSMTSPSFVHDFAITKKYAIFVEIQITMSPMKMIIGGSPVGVDKGKVPRIGVIPRYAEDESEMKWFEVADFNIIHAINAWEEDGGDTVVMVAPNILSVEHSLERMDLIHASVEKVKIHLKTGNVSRHTVSSRNLDFAVINPAFAATKCRYVYAGVGDPFPKICGVVKLDVGDDECIVGTHIFGPGCFGGEPFFVAREPDNPNSKEDDGYVVSFVHDENTNESRFIVMDAKSPNLEIIAAVKLPGRVPYGFHGLFLKETDLNKLR